MIARLRCWLFGHDDMLSFGDGVMALRCASCGRRTVGWRICEKEAA